MKRQGIPARRGAAITDPDGERTDAANHCQQREASVPAIGTVRATGGWEAKMFSAGFLTIGRWRGIPLRIHWSTPFGAYIFCGFQFVAPFWLAFFLLVILHELGHAFVVRRVGGTVLSVELTAIGGCCNWSGELTPLERSCVGWGGVGAQLLLLAAALAWRRVHGPPTSTAMAQFAGVF